MSYDSDKEINAQENLGSNINEEEKIFPNSSNSQSINNENFRSSENKSLFKFSVKSGSECGKNVNEVKNSIKNEDEGEKGKEGEEEEKGKEDKNDKKNTQIEGGKSGELDLTSALLNMEKEIKLLSNIINEKGNAFIKELKNTKEDLTNELKKNNETLNNVNENLKKIAEILSKKN